MHVAARAACDGSVPASELVRMVERVACRGAGTRNAAMGAQFEASAPALRGLSLRPHLAGGVIGVIGRHCLLAERDEVT